MRTNRYRFYIEVELAHSGGKVAAPPRLQELLHEAFTDLIVPGEHYNFGSNDPYSPDSDYTVISSKVCPLDLAAARRLVGPAVVGPVDLLTEDSGAPTDPGTAASPPPAPPVEDEVEILPRGRYIPEEPVKHVPARKGWRRMEPVVEPYRLGDVIEASITEPGRNRFEGKLRPCIWIADDPIRRWHGVAKMTTLDRFEDGQRRKPLQWKGGIYTKGSYLWADRITWIPERAIEKVIGHLNDADLKTVAEVHAAELRQLGVDVLV
jgi:hypothetical protein